MQSILRRVNESSLPLKELPGDWSDLWLFGIQSKRILKIEDFKGPYASENYYYYIHKLLRQALYGYHYDMIRSIVEIYPGEINWSSYYEDVQLKKNVARIIMSQV